LKEKTQPPTSPFVKGDKHDYLHPVHVVAVQLPQPPELPWELVSFPLPPTDIPNTENILWIWSLWQDGQN